MHTRSLPAKAGNDGYAGTFCATKKEKKSGRKKQFLKMKIHLLKKKKIEFIKRQFFFCKKVFKSGIKKVDFLAYNKTFTFICRRHERLKTKLNQIFDAHFSEKKVLSEKIIKKFNLFLVDFKKRLRYFQEFKKSFILKFCFG